MYLWLGQVLAVSMAHGVRTAISLLGFLNLLPICLRVPVAWRALRDSPLRKPLRNKGRQLQDRDTRGMKMN